MAENPEGFLGKTEGDPKGTAGAGGCGSGRGGGCWLLRLGPWSR